MNVFGIELTRPTPKGLLNVGAMTLIGVLAGLLMVHAKLGNVHTVITLGSAAFSGSLAYQVGIDTRRYGPRALVVLIAFLLIVNACAIAGFGALGLHL